MNTKHNGKFMLGPSHRRLLALCGLVAYIAWHAETKPETLGLQLAGAVNTLLKVAEANEPGATTPAASARTGGVVQFDEATKRAPASKKAIISQLAVGENAFLGHLEIAGGAGVPEHRDPTEEYIYVLEGAGTISIEDQTFQIGPGDTVFMPANAKVSFSNGDATMRAIQVFAGPASAEKYEAWPVLEASDG